VIFAPVCDQEARHFAEFLMYGLLGVMIGLYVRKQNPE
jgi:hypothetical protein